MMLGEKGVWALLAAEVIAALIAADRWGLMSGFWTFAALVSASCFVLAILNFDVVFKALDISPLKIGRWVLFLGTLLVMTWGFSTGFGFPTDGSIMLAIVTGFSIWWTYDAFEPSLR